MALSVGSHRSYFSFSCPNFKRWCQGDRSHTSSAPIVCWPTVCLVTPLYFPLVASVPQGTSKPEESALEEREASGADGASLGAVGVEVDQGQVEDNVAFLSGSCLGCPRSNLPCGCCERAGCCDRTTSGRGFIDKDQLERFSAKREQKQHT
jgi:hypothetical protein